jgi:hypothetical protein
MILKNHVAQKKIKTMKESYFFLLKKKATIYIAQINCLP